MVPSYFQMLIRIPFGMLIRATPSLKGWKFFTSGGYKRLALISLSLGDQITTTLATSVLPISSEQNS